MYLSGITFDNSPLDYFWQIVDPLLLKTDLWRSISHLHSQPPLFNGFVGVVLGVFPGHENLVFSLTYKLCGLVLCLSMASLMIRLGIPPLLAAAVTAFYIVSPSVIIYENFLLYEYPAAAILCLAAWASQKFAETDGILSGLMFFFGCSVIVFLRSGFTLMWFGAVLVIAVCILRSASRKVIYACSLPLLTVLLLYTHNYYQFGFVGTSSWLGMNLTWMTVRSIPKAERERLATKAEISELSLMEPFQGITTYKRFLEPSSKTNVPVLDQEFKSNGEPNLHHIGYVKLSAQYLHDAIEVATKYPLSYLQRVGIALACFFTPSSRYGEFVDFNRKRISTWESLNDRLWCCVDVPVFSGKRRPPLCIVAVVLYALALLLGPVLIRIQGKAAHKDGERPLALVFMWFNVAYVTLLFNCIDFGENMRFRVLVEPFVWILTVWILVQLTRMVGRSAVK